MSVLLKVEEYVSNRLKVEIKPGYTYHNLEHTERVVKACKEICNNTPEITEDDKEMLLIASWFHDLGYVDQIEKHEEKSKEYARKFLFDIDYPADKISKITSYIQCTCLEENPKDIYGQIMRDADLSSLGKKSFFKRAKLLKQELEFVSNKKIGDEEWNDENINFLSKHQYYTDYAKTIFGKQKQKNLEALEAIKNEPPKLTRGVETMYRTSLSNHMQLSGLADNKANIMLSINALIRHYPCNCVN